MYGAPHSRAHEYHYECRATHLCSLCECAFTSVTCLSLYQQVRLATLTQENAVLKSELDLLRLRCKSLSEENRSLRQASVSIVSLESNDYLQQPPYFVLAL